MTEFNAWSLAKAWNSVALAQSTDRDRPTLYRTTLIEQYPEGVRLIATDASLLLKGWVPDIDNTGAVEPGPDVEPEATVVCMDRDRRVSGLMTYAMQQTAGDGPETRHTMTMQLGTMRPGSQIELTGMAQSAVTFQFGFEYDERIESPIFDGAYPPWKGLWYAHEPADTMMIGFPASTLLRLGKLSGVWGKASIQFMLGGQIGVAKFSVDAADINVEGLAMPLSYAGVPASEEGIHSTLGDELDRFLTDVQATVLDDSLEVETLLDPDIVLGQRQQVLRAAHLVVDYQYADEELIVGQLGVSVLRAAEILASLVEAGVLEALDASGKLVASDIAADIVARMDGDDGQTPEPVE
jgi:hypothetical protein